MFGKKETIAEEFERALEEPNFKEKAGKKGNQNIRCDLKRLQQHIVIWSKNGEKLLIKKSGSGLTGKKDPEWFKTINLVLAGTNSGVDNVCSDPA